MGKILILDIEIARNERKKEIRKTIRKPGISEEYEIRGAAKPPSRGRGPTPEGPKPLPYREEGGSSTTQTRDLNRFRKLRKVLPRK